MCLAAVHACATLRLANRHTPEYRFAQHKAGGRLAAGTPHNFGTKLRLDLMQGIGTFSSRTKADAAEKAVAEALQRKGHCVFLG
jgi:hypothetical protein